MTTEYALVISSGFFLFPAFVAVFRGNYFIGCVLGITSLVSGAYWHNPANVIVRNLDLAVSKASFCTMAYYGCRVLNHPFDFTYGTIVSGYIVGFYITACMLYRMNDPAWRLFYFVFHFYTAYLQWFIVMHLDEIRSF